MATVVTRDVLAKKLADRAEITIAAARDEVSWFFDSISSSLEKGDEVRIHGFGAFKTAQRAARVGRNPRTGESVRVPARRVVRFSPSTTLSQPFTATPGPAQTVAQVTGPAAQTTLFTPNMNVDVMRRSLSSASRSSNCRVCGCPAVTTSSGNCAMNS